MLAPIAIFAYNRPRHLARVLEALRSNPEAGASDLFIYSDAPKDPVAAPAVEEVRRAIRQAGGFRSVSVVEQAVNLGISRSVISGVGDLVHRFGRAVVLEDDLLPSPNFLRYVNDALDEYEHDTRVVSVHAYSYPVKAPLPETFFLRGADCWGWATWARGWQVFEPDGRRLLAELRERKLTAEFDLDGDYPYTRMLEDQIEGRNDSWAVRWHAAAFLRGLLTLYPGRSQIQNIGADGSGSNVGRTREFEHERWGGPVKVGGIALEESLPCRRAFGKYLRDAGRSLPRRLLARVLGG
jgi:Glycosyl transferase family 2